MQTSKERVFAVKHRINEIEVEKKIRKRRILGISSLSISLFIILGLALHMPSIVATISNKPYTSQVLSASIFDGSNFLGCIIIGILAFSLGVSVTILCYRIKQRDLLDQEELGD